jgi:hypothetical protein
VLPLDAPLRLTTALPLAAGADTAAVGAASRAPLDAAGLGPARPGAPQRRPAPRRDSVATTVNARGDTARVRTVTVDPAEVLGDDPRVRRAVDSAVAASDTSGRGRLTFRQSSENVSVQRNLLRVARAQRVPALQLSGNYQRFAYPQGDGIVFPNSFGQFVPELHGVARRLRSESHGGRIRGDILQAEANLREAEATARQVEQLSSLDARLAVTQLEQAEASFSASAGTAEQAARAFGSPRCASVRGSRRRSSWPTRVSCFSRRRRTRRRRRATARSPGCGWPCSATCRSRRCRAARRPAPAASAAGRAAAPVSRACPNQQGGSVTGGAPTGAAGANGGAAGAGGQPGAGGGAGGAPGTAGGP